MSRVDQIQLGPKFILGEEHKQLRDWSEEQYGKFWNLFPNFLLNYKYNFENIFTAWSLEG